MAATPWAIPRSPPISPATSCSSSRRGGTPTGGMGAGRRTESRSAPSSNVEKLVVLGFVGEPEAVDPHIVDVIIHSDLIPVIAPIGVGPGGETLNINADTFAAALATAMKAKRLLLLTDVEGVLDRNGNLIK